MTGDKLSVMIVEDDAGMRDMVRLAIKDDGEIEASEAGDLATAAKLMTTKNYDAILLDVNLPDATRTEPIKVLRQMANTPGIPPTAIIVMTAFTEAELPVKECLLAGADDVIRKDEKYDFQRVLKEKIHHSCGRNAARPYSVAPLGSGDKAVGLLNTLLATIREKTTAAIAS